MLMRCSMTYDYYLLSLVLSSPPLFASFQRADCGLWDIINLQTARNSSVAFWIIQILKPIEANFDVQWHLEHFEKKLSEWNVHLVHYLNLEVHFYPSRQAKSPAGDRLYKKPPIGVSINPPHMMMMMIPAKKGNKTVLVWVFLFHLKSNCLPAYIILQTSRQPHSAKHNQQTNNREVLFIIPFLVISIVI